jgi:hypothetical protein
MNQQDEKIITERELHNARCKERAARLLENNRLIGLELEDAKEIIKAYGFVSTVHTYYKKGYDLISATYCSAEIKLFINEGETKVVTARHG